jgi:hypothetical protein
MIINRGADQSSGRVHMDGVKIKMYIGKLKEQQKGRRSAHTRGFFFLAG